MPKWPDVHRSKTRCPPLTIRSALTLRQRSWAGNFPKTPIQHRTVFTTTISLTAAAQSEMEIIICNINTTTTATESFQCQTINWKWTSLKTKWSSWWTTWTAPTRPTRHSGRSSIIRCCRRTEAHRRASRKRRCSARCDVIVSITVLMAKAINCRLMAIK